MKDRKSPDIVRMCERWSGGQRLRDVVASFGDQEPTTHVGNLARFLLARPSLRVRHCERLLADAVGLARLMGSDGSAVALVKRCGNGGGGGGGAEGQAWDTGLQPSHSKSSQVIPSHPKSLAVFTILMVVCACRQCLRR